MNRRNFIKTIGLTASLPSLCATAAHGAERPTVKKPALKLLTCNIRVDVPSDARQGNNWEARKHICADVIKAQSADVICLQECEKAHIQHLKQRLPDYEAFGLANPGPVFNPANSILFLRSRFEMISAGGFWLSQTPHIAGTKSWDSAVIRFVNWVQLKERKSGQEFRVWNTHLDHIGQTAREKQAELIMQASDVLPKELPQFLTADFNAQASNPAIGIIKAAGWSDSYEAVHGSEDPGFTFHGFIGPKYADKPGEKLKGRIDWIFYRGPVKPVSAEIVRDSRNGGFPSDHYFVSSTVLL